MPGPLQVDLLAGDATRSSASWDRTRDPTKTVWHSVPEVELCTLQTRTQALPLQASVCLSLTSW